MIVYFGPQLDFILLGRSSWLTRTSCSMALRSSSSCLNQEQSCPPTGSGGGLGGNLALSKGHYPFPPVPLPLPKSQQRAIAYTCPSLPLGQPWKDRYVSKPSDILHPHFCPFSPPSSHAAPLIPNWPIGGIYRYFPKPKGLLDITAPCFCSLFTRCLRSFCNPLAVTLPQCSSRQIERPPLRFFSLEFLREQS